MLESKLQINQIYEQAQKEILHLKQNESIIKKDKDLFWNEYRKNPIEAIEAIKISSEKIVTPMTKVKKK